MARKSSEAARAAAREIGRVTVIRLTVYYLMAGVLLLCLSAPCFPRTRSRRRRPASRRPTWRARSTGSAARSRCSPAGAPRWLDALLQMIAAFLLVLPLAFVYVRTRTRIKFDHSLVQTVIVLPIVVTAILVVVRDSLALAFSLAGIVAAVRFRNNLKESGDAVYIFGSIGIGFATGIHAISVAAVLSIVFVIVELALWKFDFSAEFERTFARLCLPSGADLAELRQRSDARRKPARQPGDGAGDGRTRRAPDLRGPGGGRPPGDRGDPRARRQALDAGADGSRQPDGAPPSHLPGAGQEERGHGRAARAPAAGRRAARRRRRRAAAGVLTRLCHCAHGSRTRAGDIYGP